MKQMKKYQAIDLVNEGKIVEALKIVHTFQREFTKEQKSILKRAHEMQSNPKFYEQLGYNADEQLKQAEKIIKDVYAEHVK